MSLFVGSDGSYRGWLAALLCCSVAVNDDEKPLAQEAAKKGVCNEQPMPTQLSMFRPTTAAHPLQTEAGFEPYDRIQPIVDRPPSLKPLDFGDLNLSLPGRIASPNSNTKRMSISQPTAFRRLEPSERQRRSLIPLQLEPVTLKNSFVDFESDLSLGKRFSDIAYGIGSQSHRCQNIDSMTSGPAAFTYGRSDTSQPTKEQQPRRPALSLRSSSSSMRQQALETRSSSSSSPRHSIDWTRFNRKRNSLRKQSSDSADSDVEQGVLELNTIVEEIRLESSRSWSSDGHVSAVAPLMLIRARSETLSDIGSVFSRPRACHTDEESEPEGQIVLPMENRLSRPFTAMPDLSAVKSESEAVKTRPDSKNIGSWLRNVIGIAHKPAKPTCEDFYSCKPDRRRAVSEASVVSGLESPIDSHWSAGHSRALTAESVMTPASTAPSTGHGFPDTHQTFRCSLRENEVGLAF